MQSEEESASGDSGEESASGDTAGSVTEDEIEAGADLAAVAARRTESAQPMNRRAGDKHPFQEPAVRNMRPDVGGISMFIGNWGERASTVIWQRKIFDANIRGSPGEVVVLFEANHAVAAVLEEEPSFALDRASDNPRWERNEKAPLGNVSKRDWWEHYVVVSTDSKKRSFYGGSQECLRASGNASLRFVG